MRRIFISSEHKSFIFRHRFVILAFICCFQFVLIMSDEANAPDEKKPKVDEDAEETDTGSREQTDSPTMAANDCEEEKKEEVFSFPDSLEGFNLAFNEDGELRDTDTKEAFVFKVKENNSYNQKRYEHIGELITEYVYSLLETETKLKRIYLPEDAAEDEPRSFVFASEDALTNPDRLMLLIHGSGVVRAGQWARRLIMNNSLDNGTQLPYIKRAVKEGYGVIVTNTNFNQDPQGRPIPLNSTPDSHGQCVWDSLVQSAAAKEIAIVAHSYGGVVVTNLALKRTEEFLSRVKAVAFTDSVHSLSMQGGTEAVQEFYSKDARNWVSSDEPLDTPIEHRWGQNDAPLVSAGHQKHEWTSYSAMDSVFEFFKTKMTQNEKEEL
ncbi:hypothetical protein CAPTEDRAFT_148827 [Capitella teleta]|uniref:Arb2 domain-containing protein n=1 Tax=Capitella teleta TaxID=283909 RepID=R7UDD5_CAPTE|nr:hypothetical protein CAPTEDRAFT_148827 [Capitella teleta]|eukprot:ELU03974.1 hypothetical protein CAPTEDRAFT_148827 [Capitella teleta]